jgi:hypothetical protein
VQGEEVCVSESENESWSEKQAASAIGNASANATASVSVSAYAGAQERLQPLTGGRLYCDLPCARCNPVSANRVAVKTSRERRAAVACACAVLGKLKLPYFGA